MAEALGVRSRLQARRTYDRVVARDLAGLCGLLPPELRDKEYTAFLLAPTNGDRLIVGLVYGSGSRHVGNPPNVGMEFDVRTGELLRIEPEGVGLGIK